MALLLTSRVISARVNRRPLLAPLIQLLIKPRVNTAVELQKSRGEIVDPDIQLCDPRDRVSKKLPRRRQASELSNVICSENRKRRNRRKFVLILISYHIIIYFRRIKHKLCGPFVRKRQEIEETECAIVSFCVEYRSCRSFAWILWNVRRLLKKNRKFDSRYPCSSNK